MSNWQEWVVGLLLLLCLFRIGQSVRVFFHRVKEKKNPCENCTTGCELKQLYDKKRSKCSEDRENTNKNCCG